MDELLDTIGRAEGLFAYLALLVSAALEYIFPPFPGDTVTLFGAFLITARGWSAAAVVTAVTLGSLLGAAVDYAVGVRLAREPEGEARTWLGRYWQRGRGRLKPLTERLRRRGASYIIINRFLPGVRAFFFVAAGMAGLRLRAVLLYGALSALAWNALILGVGASLGASWERFRELFEAYTAAVWALLALAALALVIRWLILRRRGRDGD